VSVRSISIGEARLNGALPAQSNEKIYITGTGQQTVAKRIAEEHPNKPVELLDGQGGPGRTAANVGFKRLLERGERPILLGAREVTEAPARQVEWKWAAWAVALAVLALGLRYAEALLFRARVSNKLETIARYRATLPKIDREFNFLNYIKTNQPPYLDTITLLALSAPPGTKIENISMARRGDVTFRGSTGDAEGPGALRSKLIDSGFFSRVVLDEQAPASDGQKVNFRISAQLRPDGARKPLSFPVKAASTNAAEPVASNPKK
jgi:hypothetical protein